MIQVEEFDLNLVIASFDVKSLFTCILVTETIGLCAKNLYRNQTYIDSLSKSYFHRLLGIGIINNVTHIDQYLHVPF